LSILQYTKHFTTFPGGGGASALPCPRLRAAMIIVVMTSLMMLIWW